MDAKLDAILKLILLEFMDLRVRTEVLMTALPEDQRKAVWDAHRRVLEQPDGLPMRQLFQTLHRLSDTDEAQDAAGIPTWPDDPWGELAQLERRDANIARFEQAWTRLWDAL